MGCNTCGKKGSKGVPFVNNDESGEYSVSWIGRIIYFIIAGLVVTVLLIPFIWGVGMYLIFNTIILNKSTELLPSLAYVGKMFINYKKEDDDDLDEIDEEEFDVDNYELLNVDVIK